MASLASPLPAWCRIVREVSADVAAQFDARPTIASPSDAAAYLADRLGAEEVEIFAVILLDAQHRVLALQEVTRGLVNSTLAHPREVFRLAVAFGACAIVLAHNHPSGSLTPSYEDAEVTRQMIAAGRVLDIPVHDHIIIGLRGAFTSFAALGLI